MYELMTRSKLAEKQFYSFYNKKMKIKLQKLLKNPRKELHAHKLKGRLKGKWSCHLAKDLRMIYEIDENKKKIIVLAVGSHKIYNFNFQGFTFFFLANSLSSIASIIESFEIWTCFIEYSLVVIIFKSFYWNFETTTKYINQFWELNSMKRGEVTFSTLVMAIIAIIVLAVIVFIFVDKSKDTADTLGECTGTCRDRCLEGEIQNPVGNANCNKTNAELPKCCITWQWILKE